MTELMTREMMARTLPRGTSIHLTTEILDDINAVMDDPGLRDNFRENLLSFTSVLTTGKYKLQEYVNAVKYVSHKLMGATNIAAYVKVFPDRFQRMIDEELPEKHIHSVSSAYNRTVLVQACFEQTMTPTHIINADLYQRALNKQAMLMDDPDVSYKVQTDAANSLLTHLKPPEVSKLELDINVHEDKAINELQSTIRQLAAKQKQLIENKEMTVVAVAHSKLLIENPDQEEFDTAKKVE